MPAVNEKPDIKGHEHFLGLVEQLLDCLRLEAATRECFNLEYEIQSLMNRLAQRPDQNVISDYSPFTNRILES
jgi:hypothetical protein